MSSSEVKLKAADHLGVDNRNEVEIFLKLTRLGLYFFLLNKNLTAISFVIVLKTPQHGRVEEEIGFGRCWSWFSFFTSC